MKAEQWGTTTGDKGGRQFAEFACRKFEGWNLDFMGGGPLDAPRYIPSGSCNSTEWVRGSKGQPVPHVSTVNR